MRKFSLLAVLTLVVATVSGCAQIPLVAPASPTVENHYKSQTTPPPGFARVYILNPLFSNNGDKEVKGEAYIATDKGRVRISNVNETSFIAFDVTPGSKTITITPSEAQAMTFDENKTYYIKPHGYGPGVGAAFGLIGALVAAGMDAGKPRYEFLDADIAMSRIRKLSLSSITPEGLQIVRQEGN